MEADGPYRSRAVPRSQLPQYFSTASSEQFKLRRGLDGSNNAFKPGFTLRYQNDLGTKTENAPRTTDITSSHFSIGDPEAPRSFESTAAAGSLRPTEYQLRMTTGEKWALRKTNNQDSNELALPGSGATLNEDGAGVQLPGPAFDARTTQGLSYQFHGAGHTLAARPGQQFTVRNMNDIGSQEQVHVSDPSEVQQSNVPLPPYGESSPVKAVPGMYRSSQRSALANPDEARRNAKPAVRKMGNVAAGTAVTYATTYDIINGGAQLNAAGAFENFAAAKKIDTMRVERIEMAAAGAVASYNPTTHWSRA